MSEVTSVEAFDLRVLDESRVRIFDFGGMPRATLEGEFSCIRAQLTRAFPLSDPHRYWGLLDGDGKDIGMLTDPSKLDAASKSIGERELDKRYFTPVVMHVFEAKEDYGAFLWDVETDKGRRTYVIRGMKDSMAELSPSRMLLTDVEGNRFEIPDITKLPADAQGIILRSL